MKILLGSLALLLVDSIPAGWITLKDSKNACQVAAPGDFKPDPSFPGLAKGPGDAVEVQVFSSRGPVKPIGDAVAKMMNIDKFIDNTDKRQFYANKPAKVKDGRTITAWTVKIATPTGNCFATITVVPGGSEDLVKKIGGTIAVSK
jgi:hypothetical protein